MQNERNTYKYNVIYDVAFYTSQIWLWWLLFYLCFEIGTMSSIAYVVNVVLAYNAYFVKGTNFLSKPNIQK